MDQLTFNIMTKLNDLYTIHEEAADLFESTRNPEARDEVQNAFASAIKDGDLIICDCCRSLVPVADSTCGTCKECI